jgi:hypothetical protein
MDCFATANFLARCSIGALSQSWRDAKSHGLPGIKPNTESKIGGDEYTRKKADKAATHNKTPGVPVTRSFLSCHQRFVSQGYTGGAQKNVNR